MVHPNVLRNCGFNPEQWQGSAFGVDGLAMLKYGMPDVRDMFASDTRWLRHFALRPFAGAPTRRFTLMRRPMLLRPLGTFSVA